MRWRFLRSVLLLAAELASFIVSAEPPTTAVSSSTDPTALEQRLPQRLTAAAGVRLRKAPESDAAVVETLPIGTPLTLTGQGTPPMRIGDLTGPWYPVRSGEWVARVALTMAGSGVSGWVFGPFTMPFNPETPDAAYQTLLKGRLAALTPRALADDLELLGFIARHLTADGPNDVVRIGAVPVVERIDSDLKRTCRFDPEQSTIDFRVFYSEIATLLESWKGRGQTRAEPEHPGANVAPDRGHRPQLRCAGPAHPLRAGGSGRDADPHPDAHSSTPFHPICY